MNEKHKLPSFFVVGGQKCGTTTLHDWFKQDSRISLPLYKETHFFSTSFSYGFKWYIKQFNNKNYQIRGEVDPSYMLYPDAFNRINNFVSNPKFMINHFRENTSDKKISLTYNFSLGDVTYAQIDQNAISGKSARNTLISQKHNFFENGRTRLVYDSF